MTDTPPLRFSDMTPGRVFEAGPLTIDAEAIKAFARQYDPQPFHTDEAAADATFFKGLAASGWHTAALSMKLFVEAVRVQGGLVGAGVDDLRWPQPVRPGDTLRLVCEVIDARPMMSSAGRGLVRVRSTMFNQRDEIVQRMTPTIVVPID